MRFNLFVMILLLLSLSWTSFGQQEMDIPTQYFSPPDTALTLRHIITEPPFTGSRVSEDGRFIVGFHWRENCLATMDMTTGKIRNIPNTKGPEGTGLSPSTAICSRDSKKLLYQWLNWEQDENGRLKLRQLRMINLDGSGMKILYDGTHSQSGLTTAFEWGHDDTYVLAVFSEPDGNHLSTINVDDGSIKTIKSCQDRMFFSISTDGRYVLLSTGDGISVLDLKENKETRLLDSNEQVFRPLWSANGEKFAYLAGNERERDLWVADFKYGDIVGTPVLMLNMDECARLGKTANDDLFFTKNNFRRDIFSLDIDPQSGLFTGKPKLVLKDNFGYNRDVTFSADPNTFIYFEENKGWAREDNLMFSDNGDIKELRTDLMRYNSSGSLSSDGSKVLILSYGEQMANGIYIIDTKKIKAELLKEDISDSISQAIWSKDCSEVYYTRDNEGVFRLDVASGQSSRIVELNSTRSLYLAPDGKNLAFTAPKGVVGLINIESREIVESLNLQEELFYSLSWTPDSQYLYILNWWEEGVASRVNRYNLGTHELEDLEQEFANMEKIAISPDGKKLYFTGDISGRDRGMWLLKNAFKQ